MKTGILLYLPPPGRGYHPESILKNLADHPPVNPLVKYSDHSWPGAEGIPNPETVRNSQNKWAVNNLIFFHGLRLAIQRGFDRMIYLECDSRVRNHKVPWDERIIGEFDGRKGAVMGGSLVAYNPFNFGREAAERFVDLVARHNTRRNYPVVGRVPFVKAFGYRSSSHLGDTCIFPMGSCAIYDINFLKALFGRSDVVELARNSQPWDKEIGHRTWAAHGVKSYDLCAQLTGVYSSYGDVLTTEDERMGLLESGTVSAVHQVKSGRV